MVKQFQGKERDYTVKEVKSSNKNVPKNEKTISLKNLAWKYVKLMSLNNLNQNRKELLTAMQPYNCQYLYIKQVQKEDYLIQYYTKLYLNLGLTVSQ